MKNIFSKIINLALVLAVLGFIGYQVYKMPKFSDGEVAPGFKAELIDGSSFSLSDLHGNYVLLDFWGSWCGPCRKESPSLVDLHNKFNAKKYSDAKGFDILSVAIETREKNWKRAIDLDKLHWPHHIVQTDRFKGAIAQQYGVREIPTKYLLDTKGEIIMVNPSFEELHSFLSSKLE